MMKMPASTSPVAMLQPFCPHYRTTFFRALQEDPGIDIYCLFSREDAQKKQFKVSDIPFTKIKTWHIKGPLFFDIRPFLRKQYRIWILMADPMLGSNWILLLFAPILKRKVILWGQGVPVPKYDHFFSRIPLIWRMMYRLSHGAWFYTETERGKWLQIYPNLLSVSLNNTLATIPEPISDQSGAEQKQLREQYHITTPVNFIFSARLDPLRRMDLLLEVINRLPSNRFGFIIIGGGANASDFAQYPNVHYFGAVYEKEKKRDLFHIANIYFQPAWLGLSVVEAMGYSLPILAFERSEKCLQGVEYGYISESGCGKIVHSVDEAVEVILSTSADQWIEMGKRGRSYVEKNLMPENMIGHARSLLKKISKVSTKE